MNKIGLSTCGFAITVENFKKLSDSSIDVVEISMPSEQYGDIDYKKLKSLSDTYGVDLWSYHLPFYPFDKIEISSLDAELRNGSVELFKGLIDKATDIGIKNFVVHPSGEPIADNERSDRLRYSMQSLDILALFARTRGAVIAVEDLPRTCLGNTADEIEMLISANDDLRVCFDTNHLLTSKNEDFLRQLYNKIITTHISDYDFIDEKHWLPGEGSIDWKSLASVFKEVGYDGPWLYEIGLKKPLHIS